MNNKKNVLLIRTICNKTFFPQIHHFCNMATISNNGTTRQKPRLDVNGYSYIMDRSASEKTYWRCIKSHSHRCHSRLRTYIITNNIIKPPTDHSYTFNGTTLEIRKFDQQISFQALNTRETPDIIITHCYKGKTVRLSIATFDDIN